MKQIYQRSSKDIISENPDLYAPCFIQYDIEIKKIWDNEHKIYFYRATCEDFPTLYVVHTKLENLFKNVEECINMIIESELELDGK